MGQAFAMTTTTSTTCSFLDCHGDYRAESHLEDPTLPLYAQQATLPRLPIPSLQETIDHFLPSALPLAGTPAQATSLITAARSFPQQAAHLQDRLVQRSLQDYHDSSWLQQWWTQQVYLQCRDPLLFSSFFYRLLPDDSCQQDGVARAAAALQSVAVLAHDVRSGQRPPDAVPRGRSPSTATLCSTQYKYLFHSCRIPRPEQDVYRIYTPSSLQRPHVAVACQGKFYKMYLADAQGRLYRRAALQGALQRCKNQAARHDQQAPKLGWLTATNRDSWSDTYKLLSSHPAMATALHELQSAVCVVCLDDNNNHAALTDAQHAAQIWHGNLTHSPNRWMDKSMQIIVNDAGGLGYVGEHSMMDGMPAMVVSHCMMDEGRTEQNDPPNVSHEDDADEVPVNIFKAAFGLLDSTLAREIESRLLAARQEVTDLVSEFNLDVLEFKHFGSKEIKATGCSPDAFVQVAMQLASYRLFGEQVGTYEATQMRSFLHGRTETTRGVSLASQAFVNAMSPSASLNDAEKQMLMLDACRVHADTTRRALAGAGVDRHFYGLANLLKEDEEAPSLFGHELFQKSKRWRLSTSTVPGVRCGFCSVDDDGLGIGYDIKKNDCTFTIVGRKDRKLVQQMTKLLSVALDEMMTIARQPTPPAGKL